MDKKAVWFDLYLYLVPNSDKLVKIPHLKREDAETYAQDWFEMNEMHDYMLVVEGSTPWGEITPTITIVTPEWVKDQYDKLNKD